MIKNFSDFINEAESLEPTHYVYKDLPSHPNSKDLLASIAPGWGKKSAHPKGHSSHDFDNEIKIRDPKSTANLSTTWQIYMSDEDIKKYFRVITPTYLSAKKFGI